MESADKTKIQNLKWLFLDLNSFFASCEQDANPNLRGKAVAVLPSMTDSTCAIAASAEAKRYGIKTGTKIFEAKKLCPDLICVPARHDLYVQYHHKILDEVIKYVPIDKVWSIDELSSRLPAELRVRSKLLPLVQNLKNGLKNNVGEMITASVGIAPNAYLAKVATDLQKPNGLVIIDAEHLEDILSGLKLTDLPGINVRMEARLNAAKIFNPLQFSRLAAKQARAIWGSVEGEKLWYRLRGYDIPSLETHRSVVGHSRILDPEHRKPEIARLVLRRLVIKAATRLRRLELFSAQMSISCKTTEREYIDAHLKFSPTQDNFTFLNSADALWEKMMEQLKPFRLRKVAVNLFDLYERKDITEDLFAIDKAQMHHKNSALDKALDSLNQKFGAETVRIGQSPRTQAGFLGTKIAFNRIPDFEEFRE